MTKDTDKQADEEIQKAKRRRVLGSGASVPVELVSATLLAHRFVQQSRGSPNTIA